MEKDRWVVFERERSPVLGKELEMSSRKKYCMTMLAESTDGLLFGKINN